jgi:hypothetical protein
MDIKRMHEMLEKLTQCATEEFNQKGSHVDTCEMGKVVDMIKDLSESMYYRTLVKAMQESDNEEIMEKFDQYGDRRYYDHYRYADGRFAPKGHGTYRRGYEEPPYYHMTPEMYRDMDRTIGKMYYTEPVEMHHDMRDPREGKSGMSRRTYMENKELHRGNTQQDKEAKMRDLGIYMGELSEDILGMIKDSTPEENQLLKTKLSTLVAKIP